MKKSHLATLLAPLVLAATPALSADLPGRRSAPRDDYYSPVPVSNWQGLYLGINGGIGFASFTDGGNNVLGSPTGGLIGVTAGFNFVPAQNLVLGIEGDFDFSGMKTSSLPFAGFYTSGSVNDIFTIRGRVGYTFDRLLVYLTGGFAGSNNTLSFSNIWSGFYGQQSTFQTGWALGAGAEYMLTNSISAKAEYLFTSVGSSQYFGFGPASFQSGVNNSQIKLGINYHF